MGKGFEMYRRFACVKTKQDGDEAEFAQLMEDGATLAKLNDAGVCGIEGYHKGEQLFVLLEVDHCLDYAQILEVLDRHTTISPQIIWLLELLELGANPLPRIYEKDQKESYSASQGQLKTRQTDDFTRFVLTLDMVKDPILLKKYKEIHAPGMAWPEITQNMDTVGVKDMEIYMDGYRAFLIMDTKPNFDWDVDGKLWETLPREKEWQSFVSKFQKTDGQNGAADKWLPLTKLQTVIQNC